MVLSSFVDEKKRALPLAKLRLVPDSECAKMNSSLFWNNTHTFLSSHHIYHDAKTTCRAIAEKTAPWRYDSCQFFESSYRFRDGFLLSCQCDVYCALFRDCCPDCCCHDSKYTEPPTCCPSHCSIKSLGTIKAEVQSQGRYLACISTEFTVDDDERHGIGFYMLFDCPRWPIPI